MRAHTSRELCRTFSSEPRLHNPFISTYLLLIHSGVSYVRNVAPLCLGSGSNMSHCKVDCPGLHAYNAFTLHRCSPEAMGPRVLN